MARLLDLTIAEARDALRKGDTSPTAMAEAYIGAMEMARPLNAFITETPDRAMDMARASEERLAKGEGGALEGIPIGVKDLFCTEGVLSTAGSHILDGFVPTYESTVTARLFGAGAVMLGKCNLDEFAMGSSNMTSYYGPVENPWRSQAAPNAKLVPGGSSGGSAAAVAAHAALAATGTDTGGSIRQPGAFTGIVGLKPTYGRCSRWGIIAFASSLDQAGPLTRTVRDAAIMLGAMAGHDPKDSTSIDRPVPDYEAALTGDVRGLRIGVPEQYRVDGMPGEIEALWTLGGFYPDHWPKPKDGWTVSIEGDPSFQTHFMSLASLGRREATIGDHVQAASVATAMQAVNAIPALCEAEPGWRSSVELGLVHTGIGFRDTLGPRL